MPHSLVFASFLLLAKPLGSRCSGKKRAETLTFTVAEKCFFLQLLMVVSQLIDNVDENTLF